MKNIKDDMDIIFLSDSSQPDMESLVVRAHQAPNQFWIFSSSTSSTPSYTLNTQDQRLNNFAYLGHKYTAAFAFNLKRFYICICRKSY